MCGSPVGAPADAVQSSRSPKKLNKRANQAEA
jgi:hypothetical protein